MLSKSSMLIVSTWSLLKSEAIKKESKKLYFMTYSYKFIIEQFSTILLKILQI